MSETVINVFLVMSGIAVIVIALAVLVLLVLLIRIFKDIQKIIQSFKEGSALAMKDLKFVHKNILHAPSKMKVIKGLLSFVSLFRSKKKDSSRSILDDNRDLDEDTL